MRANFLSKRPQWFSIYSNHFINNSLCPNQCILYPHLLSIKNIIPLKHLNAIAPNRPSIHPNLPPEHPLLKIRLQQHQHRRQGHPLTLLHHDLPLLSPANLPTRNPLQSYHVWRSQKCYDQGTRIRWRRSISLCISDYFDIDNHLRYSTSSCAFSSGGTWGGGAQS